MMNGVPILFGGTIVADLRELLFLFEFSIFKEERFLTFVPVVLVFAFFGIKFEFYINLHNIYTIWLPTDYSTSYLDQKAKMSEQVATAGWVIQLLFFEMRGNYFIQLWIGDIGFQFFCSFAFVPFNDFLGDCFNALIEPVLENTAAKFVRDFLDHGFRYFSFEFIFFADLYFWFYKMYI